MAKPRPSAAAHRRILRIFDLFGLPLRVTIFQRLAREPMSAGELAKGLPITRPAVVQHLKRMQAEQLVDASTEGRRRVYRIDPRGLEPLRAWLKHHLGD